MKKILNWFYKHWLKLLIALGVIIGGYFYFKEDTVSAPTIRTQIETAERGDISVAVSGSGQIQADSQVDLKPVAAGDAIEVTSVLVKNDQAVTKGQIIAVLDNEDARRDIQGAQLDLQRAEIQLKQAEDLYPKETKDDKYQRQLSENSVSQSRIALTAAQDRLNDYTIRAPFDGIVTGLAVESGDTVSQTGILASVITKNMKAVITLNEVDAAKVKVGNKVNLSFDALPNDSTTGTITKIDTIGTADQGVVSYGAEVSLDELSPNLKPGMSVSADISVEEKKNVLLIPNAALTYEEGKSYVRMAPARGLGATPTNGMSNMQTQRGERKEVALGITNNINTEVLSGLNEGDKVLVINAGNASSTGIQATSQNQGGFLNIFRGGGTTNRGNFSR